MSPRSEEQFEAIRQKSRQAILRAALRLFARDGYTETTTADIARCVGVSKGLIYNYFSSKEKILERLIDEFVEKTIPAIPLDSSGQPPSDYLEELIRGWFHEVRTNPDLIRIGVQFHTDNALKKLFRKKLVDLEKNYVGFFEEVFRRLGSPDPEVDTLILGSILDGVGMNYAAAPAAFPLDKVERHLIKHYCRPGGDFR